MMMRPGRGLSRPTEKAQNTKETFSRLIEYLKPHGALLGLAGLMMLLNALFQLAGPYLTGRAVDAFIAKGDLNGLNQTMLLLLGIYIGGWITRGIQLSATVRVGQYVLYKMRDQLFQQFQRLSLRFFDQHETGDLISRLTSDTDAINRTLNMGLSMFISNIVFLVGVFISMILLNWKLALISMSVLPLMFLSTSYFSKRVRAAARRSREQLGKVSAELEETIAGVRVVQAFSREQETLEEFQKVNAASRDANVQAEALTSAFAPTLDIFSTVGIALVLGIGGMMVLSTPATSVPVLQGTVTVGTIVTFLGYVRRFFQPVRAIGVLYAQIQTAIAAAERIFQMLDQEPEITNSPNALVLEKIHGKIVFENVTFGYKDDEPVLNEVSFQAAPGETIAIVGPTGAGKTTLVNLLMRFYDIDSGCILIDGHEIRTLSQESLRQQVGMVLQDTFLFSGTVMENIRYGRLNATDDEVITASQNAGADTFIRRLPDGYQTVLNEQGASLSQGQRQLLSIARAILANPQILILDEATSSVDTRTERLIQSALADLMQGRTSIVIAHRLSTITHADQVLVICKGKIIEQGTHKSLLAHKGFYYQLYASQFEKTEADAGANEDIPQCPEQNRTESRENFKK